MAKTKKETIEIANQKENKDNSEVLPEAEVKEEIPVFYVLLKVPELVVRSTPEFKADNSNVVNVLKNGNKPIGISMKKDGYGKLANSDGWIQLAHTNRFNG